jgi:Fe-S-cluster containining protein
MNNLIHLDPNPCVTCGACCVTYRASFHWLELASAGGTVPDELAEQLTPHLAVMKGSNGKNIRCCALDGTVGGRVSCSIYPQRSSSCRDFPYSGENGVYHDRCEKARARVGLPPLMQPPQEPPDSPDSPEGDDPQAPETTPGRAA